MASRGCGGAHHLAQGRSSHHEEVPAPKEEEREHQGEVLSPKEADQGISLVDTHLVRGATIHVADRSPYIVRMATCIPAQPSTNCTTDKRYEISCFCSQQMGKGVGKGGC